MRTAVALIGVLSLVAVVTPVQAQGICGIAVATQGDWWGGSRPAEWLQRAMEQVLLNTTSVIVFKLERNEVDAILQERQLQAYGQTNDLRTPRRLGVCKIIFVRLDVREEQQQLQASSSSGPTLFDLLLSGQQNAQLRQWTDALGLTGGRSQQIATSVTAIRYEVTAELIQLPRQLLFSDNVIGAALIAQSGYGYVAIGSQSYQYQQMTRSDIESTSLRLLAQVLVGKMKTAGRL